MYSPYPSATDFVEIEDRARQLRAEAVRYGTRRAVAWFKSLFSGATTAKSQHA